MSRRGDRTAVVLIVFVLWTTSFLAAEINPWVGAYRLIRYLIIGGA